MKIYVYLPCSDSCIYLDKDFVHNDTMFDFSQDIPALAAEASKEHSNVPYIVTAPLGLHELMVVCSCEFPLDYFYRIQQSLIERQSRYDVNLICSYLHFNSSSRICLTNRSLELLSCSLERDIGIFYKTKLNCGLVDLDVCLP